MGPDLGNAYTGTKASYVALSAVTVLALVRHVHPAFPQQCSNCHAHTGSLVSGCTPRRTVDPQQASTAIDVLKPVGPRLFLKPAHGMQQQLQLQCL